MGNLTGLFRIWCDGISKGLADGTIATPSRRVYYASPKKSLGEIVGNPSRRAKGLNFGGICQEGVQRSALKMREEEGRLRKRPGEGLMGEGEDVRSPVPRLIDEID